MLSSHGCQQCFGGTIWVKIQITNRWGITPYNPRNCQENVMNAVHKKGETLQQQSKHLLSDLPHQNAVREGPIYQQHKKSCKG